jgi:hypothetical protein
MSSYNVLLDMAGNGLVTNAKHGVDERGRPGETFAYSYNNRNRLSSVTRNAVAWGSYVYNGLEQLVSRVSQSPAAPIGTIHYIYDLDGHLIA